MAEKNIPNILKQIVAVQRREVERLKVEVPASQLERRIEERTRPQNLAGALWGDTVRVIAEVKKASPTRGVLRADFDPASLAAAYADNGAAAISVLTNAAHFQGSVEHLEAVHKAVGEGGIPVLRKEFIFDPYQVCEARAYGADAVLLIVSILSPRLLGELLKVAQSFWMQALVEVHDEEELKVALDAGAEIIGINNRNLHTFDTDLAVTERLAPLIPADRVIVSESGISSRDHIERLQKAGVHAVLVGEALVTADDPDARLRELV